MIHVVAILTAKPGQRAAFMEVLRANIPAVRAEQGCIEYGPTVDVPGGSAIQTLLGDDTLVIMEKWESIEAWKAHAAAPHMGGYAAKAKERLASRTVHVLTPA